MSGGISDRGQQTAALVAATTASFLTPFLGSSINVALPAIGAELGMSAVQLSWVATAFLLASAVCLVPFGRMADLLGRRRIFLTGMMVFALASLGCGFTHSARAMIAWRAMQGIGAAMIFGTGLAILTSAYPASERGRVIGWNSSAVYLGLSVGPFIGGLLTRRFGWPSTFLAVVPLALASAAIAWRNLNPDQPLEQSARFDRMGAVLYGGALILVMSGLSALPGRLGLILVVVGIVLAVGFVRWERRVASPMLDLALLAGNPVFAWSNLAALINYSATYAVTFLASLYLQYVRGFDPATAGLFLLAQSAVMALMSPFAGRLSDHIEPRIVASLGMALTVAGLAAFAFVSATTPLYSIVLALLTLGCGFGLFSSPNTNAVMSAVGKPRYGVASAMLGTMRLLGQTTSMGLTAAGLALAIGHSAITPANHPAFLRAMHWLFLLSAALCLVGIFASLARGQVRPVQSSPSAPPVGRRRRDD